MGRPLIYICSVMILVLGMIQINLNNRHLALASRTASYANISQMRNMAHSGVELTLHKLREDVLWRNNDLPYAVSLDYGTANVIIRDNVADTTIPENHLRLISRISQGIDTTSVSYLVEVIIPQLPVIPAALTITDNNFSVDLFGSFDINGNDESGIDPVGLPGITVIDQQAKDRVIDGTQKLENIVGNTGTGSVEIDQSLDFDDIAYLIEMLAPNATRLSGNYTTDLGSPEQPGVFFVEDYAKITGDVNGYGILVVRTTGDLELATLDLKGTFDFHGLVLFENSWALDTKGTAEIHGSVVVGAPDNPMGVNIEMGGNAKIFYNKQALAFAEEAAKMNIPATFKVKDIYE